MLLPSHGKDWRSPGFPGYLCQLIPRSEHNHDPLEILPYPYLRDPSLHRSSLRISASIELNLGTHAMTPIYLQFVGPGDNLPVEYPNYTGYIPRKDDRLRLRRPGEDPLPYKVIWTILEYGPRGLESAVVEVQEL